jgi:ubiquinone/menaquinone biosynthesis C-methylase UbiE
LGSGAGNDCFVARSVVGEKGKVTGLDFTDEMVAKARENNQKLGFENVDFVKGDIEEMPFQGNSFDVVISNCVLNLVPDKYKAFSEIFRVLKNGGHFCVSDVVIHGELPEKIRKDMEMYVGCVSGAIHRNEYIEIIKKQGFTNIEIHREKKNDIPENILAKYFNETELMEYKNSGTGIFNITVSAYKP